MRYFIIGATVDQVKAVGGTNSRSTRVGVFATLTKEQVDKLKALGAVVKNTQKVESSVVLAPVVVPPSPVAAQPTYSAYELTYAAGFEEIRNYLGTKYGVVIDGAGVNVAVVGTGIRATHEMLNSRVVSQRNYTTEIQGDQFDHDTGVASLVVAVAPMCNILDFKVLDREGAGTDEEVVAAIDDIITMQEEGDELAPNVVNLSLGTSETAPDSPLRMIVREAISRNIFLVASNGNSGPIPGSVTSPACEQYVFAAGSVDPLIDEEGNITSFVISQFSSRGPTQEGLVKPDVVFFGRDIMMASSASDTATVAKSGTSFATPFLSGACATGLQGASQLMGVPISPPPMTPEELINKHMPAMSVKPAYAPSEKDNEYGYGLPYGPAVMQEMRARAIAAMTGELMKATVPIIMLGMVGMVIVPAIKEKS